MCKETVVSVMWREVAGSLARSVEEQDFQENSVKER